MIKKIKKYFEPNKERLLINAIIKAEKNWPNNMDFGNVMRKFVHITKDQRFVEEEELHDLLTKLSTKSKSCKL